MRTDVPRGRSIELKLPLLIGGLLVLTIGGFSAAAYTEVQRSTLVAAAERLERVTRQLADILQAGAPQRVVEVREAAAEGRVPQERVAAARNLAEWSAATLLTALRATDEATEARRLYERKGNLAAITLLRADSPWRQA